MCDLTLYRDNNQGAVSVSNFFIDEFLADANDAQIKIYLYLLRMTSSNLPTDISEIADKYGDDRRTEIKQSEDINVSKAYEFDKRDLINKEDVMVCLTRDGYIKRSSLKSYKSSEGAMPGVKTGDNIIYLNEANTEDYLIAFTRRGNYIVIPIHEIPEGKWKDEGKQLSYRLNYNAQEDKFIKAFSLKTFRNDLFFVLVSRGGQIKRTFMSDFALDKCSRVYTALRLLNSDELVDVAISTGSDNILLFMANGEASYYNEDVLTPIGPKAGGVKAAKLNKTTISAMLIYQAEERGKILLITDHGHYRVFDNQHIDLTKRLIKPTLIMPTFKGEPHKIIAARKFNRSEGEISLSAITQLKGLIELKINDFYFTPLEKYAKTNLNIAKRDTILYIYSFGEVIDPKLTSTYKPKPVETPTANAATPSVNEVNKEEKKPQFTQISIFDEDNNDNNGGNNNG